MIKSNFDQAELFAPFFSSCTINGLICTVMLMKKCKFSLKANSKKSSDIQEKKKNATCTCTREKMRTISGKNKKKNATCTWWLQSIHEKKMTNISGEKM